jgi:hypothetical protein
LGSAALFFFTHDEITETFRLDFFPDFATSLHTMKTVAAILALNAVAGVACALPSVVLALLGRRPQEVVHRKQNRLRQLQRLVGTAFPYSVLAASHALALSLGFGAAPQWARSLTREANPLSEYSRFVHDFFYYPAESESTRDRWKDAFGGGPGKAPKAVVIFAPSSLLSQAAGLPKTRRALGEPMRFFADSASPPAFFAELFFSAESANLAFHLPVPDEFASLGMADFLASKGSQLGLRWDEALGVSPNLLLQFAPEWRVLGEVVTGEATSQDGSHEALERRHASTLRLLQSQVHLFALARYDLFRVVHRQARWTNLVADDLSFLEAVLEGSARMRGSAGGDGLVFLQLSELERAARGVRPPLSPLRWPDGLAPAEQRWLVNKFDSLLGFGFQVAAGTGPSVFVVPYPDGNARSQLSFSFARPRGGEDLETILPARVSDGFLTVDDVTLALRHAVGKSAPQGEGGAEVASSGDAPIGLHCERHFADLSSLLSDEDVPSSRIQESYWNVVGRYSDERFRFPSALSFLSGSGFEHSVICRPTRQADPRSFDTSQSWIIRWVRHEEADIISTGGHSSKGVNGMSDAHEGTADELRRALVKFEGPESRRAASVRPPWPLRAGVEGVLDSRRMANYELFRLSPDIQAGLVLRRATQIESVEFLKRWGVHVDAQFEQGARAQLH